MARDVTSLKRYEALPERSQDAYSRVLDAVDLMVEHPDWSRSHAARVAHTDTRTIDRYASHAFERRGGRQNLRPSDRLYRSETMPALVPPGDRTRREGGPIDVEPRTRRQRSVLGNYWNDVQELLKGRSVDMSRYRRVRIAGHRLETDPARIRQTYESGRLYVIVEISPRV